MADEIDIENIKFAIGRAVQQTVGDLLYQQSVGGGVKEPAVFIARQDKPYTHYPFVIVDYDGTQEPEGWIQGQLVNDDGEVEYFQSYIMSYSIQVYDSYEVKRASSIATRIMASFNQLSGPSDTLREIADVTLENVMPLVDYSSRTKQGFLDVFGFNITVVGTQSLVDKSVTTIDHVTQDLTLNRHKEDSTPLTGQVDIDLNSN